MKQVTIENVKARVAELEMIASHGELSLRGEFELASACLLVLLAGSRDNVGVDPYMSNAACLREINEALGMNDITMFSQVATGINDMMSAAQEREQVRADHAEWSQATFGTVGPIGPLKHLSKEALEAAAAPDDLSEWADMQFLMWDAQRRAGITDEQITQAMIDKLAVNKARQWPEPKDGEPRLHIQPENDNTAQQFEALAASQPASPAAPIIPEGLHPDTADLVIRFATALAEKLHRAEQKYGHANGWKADGWYDECLQQLWEHIEKGDPRDVAAYCAFMWHHGWVTTDYDRGVRQALATSNDTNK